MKTFVKLLTVPGLFCLALTARAEPVQACILEGTVDKGRAAQLGVNVYVDFDTARRANDKVKCRLERTQIRFSEPKNAMIEHAPDGSRVAYEYTRFDDGEEPQWRLLSVTMR